MLCRIPTVPYSVCLSELFSRLFFADKPLVRLSLDLVGGLNMRLLSPNEHYQDWSTFSNTLLNPGSDLSPPWLSPLRETTIHWCLGFTFFLTINPRYRIAFRHKSNTAMQYFCYTMTRYTGTHHPCTVEPLYNTIVFHQNTHKRHPIARP